MDTWRTAGIFSLCSSGILLHSRLPFSSSLSPGSSYHLGSPEDLHLLQVKHGCPRALALYSLPAEEKCTRLAMGRFLLDLHPFISNMGLQRGHAGKQKRWHTSQGLVLKDFWQQEELKVWYVLRTFIGSYVEWRFFAVAGVFAFIKLWFLYHPNTFPLSAGNYCVGS